MKTILYMAMTANGYIARSDDTTPWSDEEWVAFTEKVKRVGNMIVGKRTYGIMNRDGNFEALGNPFVVVVSTGAESDTGYPAEFAGSPEEALDIVRKQGFDEALVAGGATLNASFMHAGLIDEIILDVESFIFGEGVKVFSEGDFECRLKLIETKRIAEDTLQLHYAVMKG